MSIGGISISYSGGGNSWVNRSRLTGGLDDNYLPPDPPSKKDEPTNEWLDELVKQRNNYSDFWVREAAKPQIAGSDVDLVRRGLYSSSSFNPSMLNADQVKALKDKGLTDEDIANLMWAAFGLKFDESTGFYLVYVLGYQLWGSTPKFFFPPMLRNFVKYRI